MKIWIDAKSGTWGGINGLHVLEVEDGAEAAMLIDALDGMSDSGIAEYAVTYGLEVEEFFPWGC